MIDVIREAMLSDMGVVLIVVLIMLLTASATAAICCRDEKEENYRLKLQNSELRKKNAQLMRFAEVWKEEQNKAYVRGYYDSIGGYDI